MIALPQGWVLSRLDSVADVRLGRQRSPKNHNGASMRPYLRAANVGWGGLKLDDVKVMHFDDTDMKTYQLLPGDILLSEASGSPSEVGKPALWRSEICDCAFQNTLLRVRSRGPTPTYLLYFFRFLARSGAFANQSRGVGIHHLGRAKLAGWCVPLPPLEEQRRIVEILEDHLSRLDAADRDLHLVEARTKTLIRASLESMVPMNEQSWARTTVGEAGRLQLGRQRHPDWHQGPNMRPYLRVANVFEDRIDTCDVKAMDFTDVFDKFRLIPGDVLLNEGQSPEFLGRPAIYRGEPPEVAFTNTLIRFQASAEVLPEWALLVFRRHMHSGRFRNESRITTNIAHLSLSRLRDVEFPLPPIEEQGSWWRRRRASGRQSLDCVRRSVLPAGGERRLGGRCWRRRSRGD